MTDEEALALVPALREFVDAVNEGDRELVDVCLAFTDPTVLAVLAAGWVGELLDDADEVQAEVFDLRARLAAIPDVNALRAFGVWKKRAEVAEAKVAELRELMYQTAAGKPAGIGKLVA